MAFLPPCSNFAPYGQTIASMGISRADKLPLDYTRSYISGDLGQVSQNTNFFGQMHYTFNSWWSTSANVTATNSYSNGPGPYFYLLANSAVTGNPHDIGTDYISLNDQFTANSRDRMFEVQQNLNGDFTLGSMRNRFVAGLDFFNHTSNELFGEGTVDTIANTYSTYVSDVLNLRDNLMVLAALRLLFANYQNGFTNETGTDYQGHALKPEQAYQAEGGVKIDAFKHRLTGTISVYDIQVKDIVRAYIPTAADSNLPLNPKYDGRLLLYQKNAEKNRGQRLMDMNYDIHIGAIGGLTGKIIAFIASLICASLPVTGFLVWWLKRDRLLPPGKNLTKTSRTMV